MKEIPLREQTVAAAKPGEENLGTGEILLSDWTLAAVKQREEERCKKEQTAEAAVVTMKQAEVAEARIVDERAEAARRAKDEWREQGETEYALRAVEDGRQRERRETRAVPKSGIVRSRGTAKLIRGVLSTLITAAIWGAIGFGAGVYATPPDKADEFRAFVNSKLEEINGLIQREWAAIEPKAKAPSEAAAPTTPEAAPKEIQSVVPIQPAAEAPAVDAAGQKDMPDANAAPPSATPADSSNSQSAAPVPSAQPAAPAMSETPSNAAEAPQAKPVANKAPVAKPHPKPPVKKAMPKPKPKPAEHHPKAEPAEQAPAPEEPAQQ